MLDDISKDLYDVVRHAPPSRILTTMYYQFWILGRLVVALILMVLVQADHIMDDANSTICYTGHWTRNVSSQLNTSLLWDGTV